MRTLKTVIFSLAVLLLTLPASAQQRSLSGKVVDAAGNGLVGVAVLQQGTSNGVMTGADGSFSITLPKSYCGYAWPVAPNKVKDLSATTSSQYYLAIPSEDKLIPPAAYDFTVSIDGTEVPAEDIIVVADGYDASYTDWDTGELIESHIPLKTVKVPYGTESVSITLDDSCDAYQCYIYEGSTYKDMGFGDETTVPGMGDTVIATAGVAYTASVLPDGQIYRIQTKYDTETWSSDNLYAIAFEVGPAPTPVTATVDFSAQMAGAYLFAPAKGVEVSSDLAESYGFADDVPLGQNVSGLDVMVKACQLTFGDAFTPATASDYLVVGSTGFVTTFFGVETSNNGWMHNDGYPNDGTESPYGGYNGTTVKNQAIATGDKVDFFTIEDTEYWSDLYSWLDVPATVTAGEEFEVEGVAHYFTAGYNYATAEAYKAGGDGSNLEDCGLAWVNASTGALTEISGVAFDDEGVATITAPAEAGTYWLTASGFGGMLESPVIMNPVKVVVEATTAP